MNGVKLPAITISVIIVIAGKVLYGENLEGLT